MRVPASTGLRSAEQGRGFRPHRVPHRLDAVRRASPVRLRQLLGSFWHDSMPMQWRKRLALRPLFLAGRSSVLVVASSLRALNMRLGYWRFLLKARLEILWLAAPTTIAARELLGVIRRLPAVPSSRADYPGVPVKRTRRGIVGAFGAPVAGEHGR